MSAKVFTLKSSQLRQLLKSSIKALEVAIDLSTEGTPKHNESCVESCDKAVELILKSKVVDQENQSMLNLVVLIRLKSMNLLQSFAIRA
jgi:hypothetical protein